ncbi:SGNH/GDSL hydrolase family protein [Nonomuraea sp. JJY05]|uniref:SGNH/GDSL hydrolase family protein n=1 Tax=Nonomuraea sp. JJY05 TaxID=3350255 RepID=UPI00373E63D7
MTRDERGAYSVYHERPAGPVSLILGGSPAFGYGATGDERTIASRLAIDSGTPWLNMGAPAFNSTQEVILFLMHRHDLPEISDIVLVSGLNNLVIAGLPDPGHDYPQFFMSDGFFRQLDEGTPAVPVDVLRRLARAARRLGHTEDEPEPAFGPDMEERIRTALENLALDLDRLLSLAGPTSARVHYALQATAPWTDKPASPEEALLFEEDEALMADFWHLFRPVLKPEVHASYSWGLRKVCKERDIPFLDLNSALPDAVEPGAWLFTDWVHMTDRGYAAAARIISSELGLA